LQACERKQMACKQGSTRSMKTGNPQQTEPASDDLYAINGNRMGRDGWE